MKRTDKKQDKRIRKVSSRCPEIAVFFDLASESARGILRGFMSFIRLNTPWNVNFVSKSASDVDSSSLKNWSGDGILAHIPDPESYATILSKNCPVVLLARENDDSHLHRLFHETTPERPQGLGLSSVRKTIPNPVYIRCDNQAIGECAANYFLKKGFENFAYVPFPKEVCWCRERFASFRSTLQKSGYNVACFPSETDSKGDWFSQREHLRDWLLSLPKPLALFVANDFRGRQVLEVCQRWEIPVPYQIAVLGVDNDQLVCEMSYPSLSSIEIDWERAGRLAASALDRMMKGGTAAWELYGPVQVISRNSTELLRIADPIVVRILEMIRLNRNENLRVVDVLQTLPISERSAQKRFKMAVGHSIMEEIKIVRMKNVRALVADTDLPFQEIALSFGFENGNHLANLFKKEFGMTMSEYRSLARLNEMDEL